MPLLPSQVLWYVLSLAYSADLSTGSILRSHMSEPSTHVALSERIHSTARVVADFPINGVSFVDLFHALALDASILRSITDCFVDRYRDRNLDAICGIDSRGFVFGAAVAYALNKPLIPIRKQGKLPPPVSHFSYSCEYGSGALETCQHYFEGKKQVVILDDVLATGGSMRTAINLIESTGTKVLEVGTVVRISALNGHNLLDPTPWYSLTDF
jgi:adenine phosphoribosyltransferase